MYRDIFVQNGVAFDPDIEVATADLILPMVRSGLGIGFVPEPFLNGVQGVIKLKLKGKPPERQICCIKNVQHSLSSAARELEKMVTGKN
jgi:DNA-binding transcriptional LysR family regulator